jgi:hypothetical protein
MTHRRRQAFRSDVPQGENIMSSKKEKRREAKFHDQCAAHRKLWELCRLDKERRGINKTPRIVSLEQSHAAWQLRKLAAKAALTSIIHRL